MKATPPLSLFDDGPGQVRSALLVGDQPHAIDAAPTPSAWSAALQALIRLLREGLGGNWPLFGAPKWPRTTANLG